ncbi:MAG: hypothetical protein PHQ47_00565 [Candidatus Portnoybacteria bacterium]|nr:hypothetical protein [Candidatus Portnoybacteria bacterium]
MKNKLFLTGTAFLFIFSFLTASASACDWNNQISNGCQNNYQRVFWSWNYQDSGYETTNYYPNYPNYGYNNPYYGYGASNYYQRPYPNNNYSSNYYPYSSPSCFYGNNQNYGNNYNRPAGPSSYFYPSGYQYGPYGYQTSSNGAPGLSRYLNPPPPVWN